MEWPGDSIRGHAVARGQAVAVVEREEGAHVVFNVTLVAVVFFFFQAEDGIRDSSVTGVQTCALPILAVSGRCSGGPPVRRGTFCAPRRTRGHPVRRPRPCGADAGRDGGANGRAHRGWPNADGDGGSRLRVWRPGRPRSAPPPPGHYGPGRRQTTVSAPAKRIMPSRRVVLPALVLILP